jgi:hypothetical protein
MSWPVVLDGRGLVSRPARRSLSRGSGPAGVEQLDEVALASIDIADLRDECRVRVVIAPGAKRLLELDQELDCVRVGAVLRRLDALRDESPVDGDGVVRPCVHPCQRERAPERRRASACLGRFPRGGAVAPIEGSPPTSSCPGAPSATGPSQRFRLLAAPRAPQLDAAASRRALRRPPAELGRWRATVCLPAGRPEGARRPRRAPRRDRSSRRSLSALRCGGRRKRRHLARPMRVPPLLGRPRRAPRRPGGTPSRLSGRDLIATSRSTSPSWRASCSASDMTSQ